MSPIKLSASNETGGKDPKMIGIFPKSYEPYFQDLGRSDESKQKNDNLSFFLSKNLNVSFFTDFFLMY